MRVEEGGTTVDMGPNKRRATDPNSSGASSSSRKRDEDNEEGEKRRRVEDTGQQAKVPLAQQGGGTEGRSTFSTAKWRYRKQKYNKKNDNFPVVQNFSTVSFWSFFNFSHAAPMTICGVHLAPVPNILSAFVSCAITQNRGNMYKTTK